MVLEADDISPMENAHKSAGIIGDFQVFTIDQVSVPDSCASKIARRLAGAVHRRLIVRKKSSLFIESVKAMLMLMKEIAGHQNTSQLPNCLKPTSA
jgi:hypothetical protein